MKCRMTIAMEQLAILQLQAEDRKEAAEQQASWRARKREKAGSVQLKQSRASKATRRGVYES